MLCKAFCDFFFTFLQGPLLITVLNVKLIELLTNIKCKTSSEVRVIKLNEVRLAF